ncbi:hypothetical protein GBAR_LOCUS13516, partial [Geodia barretti]
MLCQALGSTPSQVEVTLVTGRREETVRERLTRASDHISLDQLRKICVVCVSDPDRVAVRPVGPTAVVCWALL